MIQPTPGEKLYDPAYYDEKYYGGGARGGFTSYDYHSEEQQKQLALKWDVCGKINGIASVLFVGCATGFEVAYALEKGAQAKGVDVSNWAIANQIPEANGRCILYGGGVLPFPDDHFELVACFDVLPHLPNDLREKSCSEMVRVASKGIVWRQIVKNWRNAHAEIDGQDGAWFRYDHFSTWDARFTVAGKFALHEMKMHSQYETTAVYLRR